MLSLFVVASFVLPSVLGHCCLPDKISMMSFRAGNPSVSHILADFTQKKYIVTHDAGDKKFTLNDLGSHVRYTKYDDGSCVAVDKPVVFTQCIPSDFKELGNNTFGNHMGTQSFGIKIGDDTLVLTYTDDCLPVFVIQTKDGVTRTRFYYNIKTDVTDVSALNVDVSECKKEV